MCLYNFIDLYEDRDASMRRNNLVGFIIDFEDSTQIFSYDLKQRKTIQSVLSNMESDLIFYSIPFINC